MVIVALLLLTSCNARVACDGEYTATPGAFDPGALARVAARWSAFSGREVTIREGQGNVCHIRRVDEDLVDGVYLAKHNPPTGNIRVSRRGLVEDFESVLAHEIGHGFGMQHVDDPTAVMFEESSNSVEFTLADRLEFDRVVTPAPEDLR
jgi:hypothetical protein